VGVRTGYGTDYGTPYKEVTGVNGSYNSLGEHKEFYEKQLRRKESFWQLFIYPEILITFVKGDIRQRGVS
jgi:hypothetical protein